MGRTPAACDKNGVLKKGPWTPEEDQKLIAYIQKNGYGNWRIIPKNAGLQRCGKSCRLRWTNYLRPDIKRGRFSYEEEETIIQLHSILGNKWSAIAARLPGRTDNEIKNYWNTHIRKLLLRMGIDPVTHIPRVDLLDMSSILSSSQMNISRLNLLQGVQPQVNPEFLRLASTTCPLSSKHENHNFVLQNVEENQYGNAQVQNQLPPLIQLNQLQTPIQEFPAYNSTKLSTTPYVPFPNETQLIQPNVDQHSSTVTNQLNPQCCQLNEYWQNYEMPPCINLAEDDEFMRNYGYIYESDQRRLIMDPPPSENSTFQSNNTNNFSFASDFSTLSTTHSSSATPLSSNSTTTYINNNNSSSTEDERESYCSNMLNYLNPIYFGC